MPKYYCDYCDKYLTHDSPSVRKSHTVGKQHKLAVQLYYQQFEAEFTQGLIESRLKEYEENKGKVINPMNNYGPPPPIYNQGPPPPIYNQGPPQNMPYHQSPPHPHQPPHQPPHQLPHQLPHQHPHQHPHPPPHYQSKMPPHPNYQNNNGQLSIPGM